MRSLGAVFGLVLALALVLAATSSGAATAPARQEVRKDSAARTLWRAPRGLASAGAVYNPRGRVAAQRLAPTPAGAAPAAAMATAVWSTPVAFGAQYAEFEGPLFDGLGHGWVVLVDGSDTVSAVERTGAAQWGAPTALGESTESGQFTFAVDLLGDVTVLYRQIVDNYALIAVRYTPATGWGAPQTVFDGPDFFQDFTAATDASGDVVAAVNLNDGASSVVVTYSAASARWSAPTPIATLAPRSYGSATAVASADGRSVAIAYAVQGTGMAIYPVDLTTLALGAATVVPDTTSIVPASGVGVRNLVVLDDTGAASLVWAGQWCTAAVRRCSRRNAQPGLFGSHGSANQWEATVPLVTTATDSNDAQISAVFGSLAIDASGRVIGSVPAFQYGNLPQTIWGLQYVSGTGWTRSAAASFGSVFETYTSAAWYGSGAILLYNGLSADLSVLELQCLQWDGSAWTAGPAFAPGFTTFGVGTANAADGTVVAALLPFTNPYGDDLGVSWSELPPP